MTLMWALAALLLTLAVIDLDKAFKEFQRDKHSSKLALHGILLIVLGLLVINTTLAAAGSEYELPYIETHQVNKIQNMMRAHGNRIKSLSRRLIRKRKSTAVNGLD